MNNPVVAGLLSLAMMVSLLLGWLIPLVVGLRRRRSGRGGKVLLGVASVWGLLVAGLVLLGVKTYRDVQRRLNREETVFNPAAYTGETATLEVAYGYPGELDVVREGRDDVCWKVPVTNGVAVIPAGRLTVECLSLSVVDPNGATQGTLYVSLAATNKTFALAANDRRRLAGGFPLTASISAGKRLNDVSLNFSMLDAAGNRVSWFPAGSERKPPSFEAVRSDGTCFWRDNFEYG